MDIPRCPSRAGRRGWGAVDGMGRAAGMLTLHLGLPDPTGTPAVQSIFTLTGTLQNTYCKSYCLYVVSNYAFEQKKEHFYFIS